MFRRKQISEVLDTIRRCAGTVCCVAHCSGERGVAWNRWLWKNEGGNGLRV